MNNRRYNLYILGYTLCIVWYSVHDLELVCTTVIYRSLIMCPCSVVTGYKVWDTTLVWSRLMRNFRPMFGAGAKLASRGSWIATEMFTYYQASTKSYFDVLSFPYFTGKPIFLQEFNNTYAFIFIVLISLPIKITSSVWTGSWYVPFISSSMQVSCTFLFN